MVDRKREARAALDHDVFFAARRLPVSDDQLAQFNALELEELKQAAYLPREVHLQVSKRCNLRCVMCSWETWESNTGLMEASVFERVLAECKQAGVHKLVFGNAQGEPFLHPRILDMIERVVAEGFWTMVSTNGTALTRERIERLARSGINHIQFSFAGYSKETYERVYVGGQWEMVTANLQRLALALAEQRAGTTLLVNGCYARELQDTVSPNAFIARTRAFLNSIGISQPFHQINIQLPHNFGGNIGTGDSGSERVGSHFRVRTSAPPLCRVLKNAPGIYHDGRVTACGCLDPNGELLIGDINQTSLATIRQGAPFQDLLGAFMSGRVEEIPLCSGCDVPYYETPEVSPALWERLVDETPDPERDAAKNDQLARDLHAAYNKALAGVARLAARKLNPPPADETAFADQLIEQMPKHFQVAGARAICHRLFTTFKEEKIIEAVAGRPVRRIGLAPATEIVLANLDWFLEQFDEVYLADNFKAGEVHFGQKILTLDELLEKAGDLDTFLVTTNNKEIEAAYIPRLPADKTLSISDFSYPMDLRRFSRCGLARADRILAEIEAADNPIVVLGNKLLATAEPTFQALEQAGHDVFVISLYDKMENQARTGWDETCAVHRNALLTIFEQLYILTRLRKGIFWIYYDFFYNVGWDAANSVITYTSAATMLSLAARPVVLGMYDIAKPVCNNMDRRHEAFAAYKVMLDLAAAVVLTSKSDHIAEYLRNTLVKDRPVLSFYRYSFPPPVPLPRLSEQDGERHLVGVTSFLGEVYEPNRVETRASIRSILRQKIHFHYYSDNIKVFAFQDELPPEERAYFHIEPAIWNQHELVRELSRYDGGWLVGDESTIFARLIGQVEDRHIRELFSLFVPNGVPTSSMTYGAAGLAVFISRQIKVMDEVYPKGCCIPLDMGEIGNLGNIFQRLDWKQIHQTMREERGRFSAFQQIPRLAAFLDAIPRNPMTTPGAPQ
jgi:hypothetical protein